MFNSNFKLFSKEFKKALALSVFALIAIPETWAAINSQNNQPNKVLKITINFQKINQKAQKYIENDQPVEALKCYQQLLYYSDHNPPYNRIALFGIGKMQIWLDDYPEAQQTFKKLLKQPLEVEDSQIALAWYMDSLSYNNQPITATKYIPLNPNSKQIIPQINPRLSLASARASLWAVKPYQALYWTNISEKQIASIPKKTVFFKQWQDVYWHSFQDSSKYQISPFFSLEKDSDQQSYQKFGVNLAIRWSPSNQTQITLSQYNFQNSQNNLQHRVTGYKEKVTQTIKLDDAFTLQMGLGQSQFPFWQPIEADLKTIYQPSDQFLGYLAINKAPIESVIGLQNKINYLNTQVYARYRFKNDVTITANPYQIYFDDKNQRFGGLINVHIPLSKRRGIGIEPRFRYFYNTKPYVNTGYFNPRSFQEISLLLTWHRHLLPGKRFYLIAGPGLRSVDRQTSSQSFFAEGGISALINKYLALTFSASYGNSDYLSAVNNYNNLAVSLQASISFDSLDALFSKKSG